VSHGAGQHSRRRRGAPARPQQRELRQPVGVQLRGERDSQPAEDGVDPALFAQAHFIPALLVERVLQAGESVLLEPGAFLYKDSTVQMAVETQKLT